MKKTALLISFIVILISAGVFAQEEFPQPKGFVNDFAGVLSENDRVSLETLLTNLEKKTTAEVAIVTIDTTSPLDIETYAVGLFEKWGIGKKGKDNGVLLLIALKDRKMRIEVGYGLEGAIPDALAKQIISSVIIPFFKREDYAKGIKQGSLAIVNLVAKEYNVELAGLEGTPAVRVPRPPSPGANILKLFLIFFFVFGFRLFFFWLPLGPRRGHRRGGHWYGTGYGGYSGGFSGGFGGFGGGLSGGGGASGGW